jgi:serine/threonine protein kinase/cytochrome c-type biogenesis protein CcmH/NrfG
MPALLCPKGHPIEAEQSNCPMCHTGGDDVTIQEGERLPLPSSERLPSLTGYEMVRKVGQGGMGEVYQARQLSLNRLVAIKKIVGGRLGGASLLAHLKREAEALACLQNPHIVQIYDVGENQGEPYLVMEYLEGGSLLDKIQKQRLSFRETAQVVATLARAMNVAHQQGIVHLDLKPENILLTGTGIPKISDFGLAKRMDKQEPGQTGVIVLGTLEYMSPEQALAKGRKIGPAADVYGLGAILYRLLTGLPPFVRPSGSFGLELLHEAARKEPVPPRTINSRVPRDLNIICLKCLEKDPQKRYASAAALADDLDRFRDGQTILARPTPPWTRAWKWCKRNPGKLAVILSLLLVLVGLGLWRHSENQRLEAHQREDTTDLATVLAHLASERYDEALERATWARQRALEVPGLAHQVPRWTRLCGIARFFLKAQEAWFRCGEERYEEGKLASEEALRNLGILNNQGEFVTQWFQHLPLHDLSSSFSDKVHSAAHYTPSSHREGPQMVHKEVYRQLLLLTYLRTVPWLNREDWKKPEAVEAYRAALQVLEQTRLYENAQGLDKAQTVGTFGRMLRELLARTGHPLPALGSEEAARLDFVPQVNPAIDHFFSGAVHYYLGQSLQKQGSFFEKLPTEMVRQLLSNALAKDLDLLHPLETAEEKLREAIRLDPRQFWHHFVLGRILLALDKPGEAELAFSACVALQPEYPVSYQFRALAVCRVAQNLPSMLPREQMLQRAGKDADRAEELAQRTKNPTISWARGQMFETLGNTAQALEAYARGLELEQEIQKKSTRGKILEEMEKFTRKILANDPTNAEAQGLLALILLSQNKPSEARQAAHQALILQPNHSRAQAVQKRLESHPR